MILECPNCETCYETPAVLPEEGRKVKCARCGHVWHAMPTPEEPEPVEEAIEEPVAEEPPVQEPPVEEPHQEIEPVAPDIDGAGSEDLDFRDAEPAVEEPSEEEIKEEVFEAMEDEQSFGETPSEPEEEFGAVEQGEPEPESEPEEPAPVEQEAEVEAEVEVSDDAEEPAIPVPPTMKPPKVYDTKMLAVAWGGFVAVVLFTLLTFYMARVEIVKTLPTSVHLYALLGIDVNIRGLEFQGIQYKRETSSGSGVLRVSGRIVNITNKPKVIPTVVFIFRDENGLELYHRPKKINLPALAPHKQVPFQFELENPNKVVHSLELRFARQRNEGG